LFVNFAVLGQYSEAVADLDFYVPGRTLVDMDREEGFSQASAAQDTVGVQWLPLYKPSMARQLLDKAPGPASASAAAAANAALAVGSALLPGGKKDKGPPAVELQVKVVWEYRQEYVNMTGEGKRGCFNVGVDALDVVALQAPLSLA
jgi:hypothetical protein